MKEIWKDVLGYEGLYQVSDYGNVKSLSRTITNVDLIPKDTLYCYTPDEERNKNRDSLKYYYIKPCPYYVSGKGNMRGCLHLKGYYTNDPVFKDQCKSCGENYPNFEN